MTIIDTIAGWLSGIGDVITEGVTYSAAWFTQIAQAIAGAIGSIIFYPFLEIMGFLASIQYLFGVLVQLVNYIFAPVWFFVNYLTGLYAAVAQNYTLATGGYAFQVSAINNFIASIPGWTELIIVINAIFWVLLGFHVLRELQKI